MTVDAGNAIVLTCGVEGDADGDGFPPGSDCDDNNANAYPGATEKADGVDNDCDGQVDEPVYAPYWPPGAGGSQGVGECVAGVINLTTGEIVTTPVLPQTEVLDGKDNDCDGIVDDL